MARGLNTSFGVSEESCSLVMKKRNGSCSREKFASVSMRMSEWHLEGKLRSLHNQTCPFANLPNCKNDPFYDMVTPPWALVSRRLLFW